VLICLHTKPLKHFSGATEKVAGAVRGLLYPRGEMCEKNKSVTGKAKCLACNYPYPNHTSPQILQSALDVSCGKRSPPLPSIPVGNLTMKHESVTSQWVSLPIPTSLTKSAQTLSSSCVLTLAGATSGVAITSSSDNLIAPLPIHFVSHQL